MAIKYRNMEVIDEEKKKKQQATASVPPQQSADSAKSTVDTAPSRENEKGSSAVSTPAATKNNAFAPSASVTAANNYLQQIRDGGYNRQWSKTLDSLVNEYMGRGAFEYDPATDALWQQAKGAGLRQGRLAMEDAIARAATLSGGYGNSYAATVGNQVYQQAVSDTMALQPEYIQAAYERYKAGGEDLLQRASLAQGMDEAAYDRYITELGLAQNEADKLYEREYGQFVDQWSRDYQTGRDTIEDERYAAALEYDKERDRVGDEQFWAQFDHQKEQDRLDNEYRGESLKQDQDQFDAELKWEKEKTGYNDYLDQLEETANEEEMWAEVESDRRYFAAIDELKDASDKGKVLWEMYVNGDLGSDEKSFYMLGSLANKYGIDLEKILKEY